MPNKNVILTNRHFSDLNPLILGEERCDPCHTFGPATRNYVLIHFVIDGYGFLYKNNREYKVTKGNAFVICPGEVTVYSASSDDPWHYQWIGFDGALSDDFKDLPPVIKFSENYASQMIDISENKESPKEYKITSLLFEMYSEYLDFFKNKSSSGGYIESVIDYIQALYMHNITVEGIADEMNLNRRYLSRIFKNQTGKTIQEYLIDVRLDEAKTLLSEGNSVSSAARLSGYVDECNFSKMFKKKFGVSPGKWREMNKI